MITRKHHQLHHYFNKEETQIILTLLLALDIKKNQEITNKKVSDINIVMKKTKNTVDKPRARS